MATVMLRKASRRDHPWQYGRSLGGSSISRGDRPYRHSWSGGDRLCHHKQSGGTAFGGTDYDMTTCTYGNPLKKVLRVPVIILERYRSTRFGFEGLLTHLEAATSFIGQECSKQWEGSKSMIFMYQAAHLENNST